MDCYDVIEATFGYGIQGSYMVTDIGAWKNKEYGVNSPYMKFPAKVILSRPMSPDQNDLEYLKKIAEQNSASMESIRKELKELKALLGCKPSEDEKPAATIPSTDPWKS